MVWRNCHCAACRFLKGVFLVLVVSNWHPLSVEAFSASPLHLPAGQIGCAGQIASRTTSSSWVSSTRRRRKRDVLRHCLQKVIPRFKRKPKESYPSSSVALATAPTESSIIAGTTEHPSIIDLAASTDMDDIEQMPHENVRVLTNHIAPSISKSKNASPPVVQKHDETIPESVADTLKRRKNSLYKPPETSKSRRLNELEEEFRNMLLHFANYKEADVLSITDPKMRLLFEGIAASAHSEPVYRAFEILFEDLLPLRVAGRVLFRKLRQFMDRSVAAQAEDIDAIAQRTGLGTKEERDKLEELRLLFLTTASKLNKSDRLSSDQLKETGILSDVATRVLGFQSTEELIAHIDSEGAGKLGFVELVVGLWDCASEVCGIEECDPQKVLFQVLLDLNRSMPSTGIDPGESAKDIHNRRQYDNMVTAFIEWKEFLPEKTPNETESRRMEIVRGCFVGAEIPGVVNALRIVYMDYRALRIAGDIIFALVSSRMKSQQMKT